MTKTNFIIQRCDQPIKSLLNNIFKVRINLLQEMIKLRLSYLVYLVIFNIDKRQGIKLITFCSHWNLHHSFNPLIAQN